MESAFYFPSVRHFHRRNRRELARRIAGGRTDILKRLHEFVICGNAFINRGQLRRLAERIASLVLDGRLDRVRGGRGVKLLAAAT